MDVLWLRECSPKGKHSVLLNGYILRWTKYVLLSVAFSSTIFCWCHSLLHTDGELTVIYSRKHTAAYNNTSEDPNYHYHCKSSAGGHVLSYCPPQIVSAVHYPET